MQKQRDRQKQRKHDEGKSKKCGSLIRGLRYSREHSFESQLFNYSTHLPYISASASVEGVGRLEFPPAH